VNDAASKLTSQLVKISKKKEQTQKPKIFPFFLFLGEYAKRNGMREEKGG